MRTATMTTLAAAAAAAAVAVSPPRSGRRKPDAPAGEKTTRDAIVKFLRERPASYTYEIAPAVGLTKAAASKLLHQMEKEGIVMEDDPECWELA